MPLQFAGDLITMLDMFAAMSDRLIFKGSRQILERGDSFTISFPKKEVRDKLGLDPDELIGRSATVMLEENGRYTIELEEFLEEEKRDLVTIDAD